MTRNLIIGSGPAAAGAALALADDARQEITVIDIGSRLEPALGASQRRLEQTSTANWIASDVRAVSVLPAKAAVKGLPEKRTYGSSYPFDDVGQLEGVSSLDRVNTRIVSSAYGGFSTIWGAQIMPFSRASFADWPISREDLEPHYRAVLGHIPFAGGSGDLERNFPLLGSPARLPPLAPRTIEVLRRYARHRDRLSALGVLASEARLAFDARNCVLCGLCMTGCPYNLIYSASQTFDTLREQKRVSYRDGLMALEIFEETGGVRVRAREIKTGSIVEFDADRVFVACGTLGSTRLVVNSLRLFDQELHIRESAQFLVPALSRRLMPDPRNMPAFTLNQFNVLVDLDGKARDLSQIHFYPYNPAVLDALPSVLHANRLSTLKDAVLRRLSIGIGYLPSWESPSIRVRADPPTSADRLPALHLAGKATPATRSPMYRAVAMRLARAAPLLDLWPVFPLTHFVDPAKSYHLGGTFPHTSSGAGTKTSTDILGRPSGLRHVHMVDAAVFPNVPATTITLTVMANAHRIAESATREDT